MYLQSEDNVDPDPLASKKPPDLDLHWEKGTYVVRKTQRQVFLCRGSYIFFFHLR